MRMRAMKKTVSILLLMALSCCLLFSVEKPRNNDNSIVIYGTMRMFSRLSVSTIESNGQQNTGMPFDIKSEDVAYNSNYINEGRRQIATWTLSTNELEYFDSQIEKLKPGLSISATPLTCTLPGTTTSLNYFLYFRIDPANAVLLADNQGTHTITSNCLKVESGNPVTFQLVTSKAAIISVDQPVRFMLANSYTQAQMDTWDYGTYSATVTVALVAQ